MTKGCAGYNCVLFSCGLGRIALICWCRTFVS